MRVIDKGYLTYCTDGKKLTVGTITKEMDMETMKVYYCFNVDMSRYNQLAEFGLDPSQDDLITAVFLKGRTRVKYAKVPYFIVERTADRRRPDIDEILKKRGLKQYNQFSLLLATQGAYPLDNWRVFREPANSIDCYIT